MSAPSIGTLIDYIAALNDEKRKTQAVVDELEAKIKEKEEELIERMRKENLFSSAGKTARARITEPVYPKVEDWDDFYKFILKKKFLHLLERRPSVTGCRELFEMNGDKAIPGVSPRTVVKVTISK